MAAGSRVKLAEPAAVTEPARPRSPSPVSRHFLALNVRRPSSRAFVGKAFAKTPEFAQA